MHDTRSCIPLVAAILLSGMTRAQFVDDFSDGDLTDDPTWTGTTASFMVNASQQLQLNDVVAATSYLSSEYAMASLDDQEWRFWIRQSFSPSGSNFGRVYLVSDQADLTAPLNGYYLQFGEAGSLDAVELFRQTGTTSTSVCRGTDGQIANSFTIGVRVLRDATGEWQLWVDPAGGTNHAQQASGTDATHATSAHLGVRCTYTASNADKFFFDDFYAGPIIVDTDPPQITTVTVVDVDELDVLFSEPVEQTSAENATHYGLSPPLTVLTAVRDALLPARVRLTLGQPLISGTTYTLTVNGVEDANGNVLTGGSYDFSYFVPDQPQYREVVINEFMADPSPVVGLPDAEFVEFLNTTTDKTFDLAGWSFTDGTSTATLPSYLLGPGEYVILTSNANANLFAFVPDRIGVASLPSLNNDADDLALRAPDNTVIDAVSYALNWYRDSNKQNGGWTLEQIDPGTPCSGPLNWIASMDPSGGTPGLVNSVFDPTPDTTPPVLLSVLVQSATELIAVFSEAMDEASLTTATYVIEPFVSVASAQAVPGTAERALIELTAPINTGTVYGMTVFDAADCTGNPTAVADPVIFALPEPVAGGDLVINEVLYDPVGTGADFVELYNRSAKTVSLQGLQLANETNGVVANYRVITNDPLLLLPGQYILLTPDPGDIATRYPQSRTDRFLIVSLPNYVNTRGTVVLAATDNSVLDLFRYDDELHFTLVNNTEGYSLERVDPDRPTSDPTNWQTAADIAGRATPGFRNSQYSPAPRPTGELTIDPAIFSPDNDGYQDLLTISYRMQESGYVGNLTIHDLAGRVARRLLENQLLGMEGAVSWDGVMDGGEKGRMGPYIVVFEVFDLAGNTSLYRKTVTLAHRLN